MTKLITLLVLGCLLSQAFSIQKYKEKKEKKEKHHKKESYVDEEVVDPYNDEEDPYSDIQIIDLETIGEN